MKPGIFALILGLILIVGCKDDGPADLVDPPELLTAISEDELMENFQEIYTEMMIDDFRDMLHEDFRLILLSETCFDWGWGAGVTLDRDDLVLIHEHMFGGSAGTDHEGNGVSPLDRIVFSVFEKVGDWATVDAGAVDFPGTRRALYVMRVYFHDNTGTHAFAVDNQIIFYATSIDGFWYLQGIRPIENKATENASYDNILLLYQ